MKEIYLSLMDKDCRLTGLAPFEMGNPTEVFLPSDERHAAYQGEGHKS